jgi:hypothetical protein
VWRPVRRGKPADGGEERVRADLVRIAATGEHVRTAANLHVPCESLGPLAASLTFGNNTPDA